MKKFFSTQLLVLATAYLYGQSTPIGKSIEYYINKTYNKSDSSSIQVCYEDKLAKSNHQKKVFNHNILELDSTSLENKVLFISMQKIENETKIIILEKYFIKNNTTNEKNIYLSASITCVFYLKKGQWICKKCKSAKF